MNTKVRQISEQDNVVIAEYRLLNALALNPNNLNESGVDENIFVHEVCKSYFKAIKHLQETGVKPTVQAIYQYASGLDVNVSLDSIESFFEIQSDVNVEVKDMVEGLSSAHVALDALKLMEKVSSIVNGNPIRSDDDNEKIAELLNQVQNKLFEEVTIKRTENFEELREDYLKDFEDRKLGKKYLFHDEHLDKAITYGPNPGNGGLICAATGMGKSAYCLNLLDNFVSLGTPCMLYTLEMGKIDTTDRWMSKRLGIPMADIVNPPDPETWASIKEQITAEFTKLKENKLFRISECASISLVQLKQDIIKFQKEIGQKYCVVFIDLLSMVREFMITDKQGVNFAQGIEVAINVLNAMAKELGIHWIGTLQLNRKSEEGTIDDYNDIKKFRPKRTDIKNSSSFLERARYSLYLFRPKYYADLYLDKELTEDVQDIVEVGLMKQNNGQVGTFGRYLFEPETMNMIPVEEELEEELED